MRAVIRYDIRVIEGRRDSYQEGITVNIEVRVKGSDQMAAIISDVERRLTQKEGE